MDIFIKIFDYSLTFVTKECLDIRIINFVEIEFTLVKCLVRMKFVVFVFGSCWA